jgi:hypothetical protein
MGVPGFDVNYETKTGNYKQKTFQNITFIMQAPYGTIKVRNYS